MNILAYMLFQNHVMHATYLNMADGDDLFFPVVVKKV